ncbi:MAG: aminotransferase class V-fold PLP-dependent enzyme [Candidatus Ornithospirochaeta sp.]|nr:aminotransferase class V-fold PLP-dependent enzyme [Candidatus Ornithospirochaeta sp.]
MRRIYLDNAATSFPKAPGTGRVMASYLENECINPNRTASSMQYAAFDWMYGLRTRISELYGYPHPECIAFTRNVTESLNWLLKGLIGRDDHVVITSLEHNAVMRPLVQIGARYTAIGCNRYGESIIDSIDEAVRPDTKAFVICAAGNVFGNVHDLQAIADKARKHNALLIIDSAQASPFIDIDMEALGAAAVAFTGHKGFLGPEGTGGFIIRKELALTLDPLIAGGTGSQSDSIEIPSVLPDRLNPGTENLVGLKGLWHSLGYALDNRQELYSRMKENTEHLYEALSGVDELRIVGPGLDRTRTNAISVISGSCDIAGLAAFLSDNGIETRVGMHCAPMAHRAMGTFPGGTLRFSPGPFTQKSEIDDAILAIREFFKS